MILNAYFNTLMILQIWKTTPSLAILWYLINMIMLMKRQTGGLLWFYQNIPKFILCFTKMRKMTNIDKKIKVLTQRNNLGKV